MVTFDGSTYLDRGGTPTGTADGGYGILAFKINPADVTTAQNIFFFGGGGARCFINTSGKVQFITITGFTDQISTTSVSSLTLGADQTVVIKWTPGTDLLSSRVYLYINGTVDITQQWPAWDDGSVEWSTAMTEATIGAGAAGGNLLLNGTKMGFLWFGTGNSTYDLSHTAFYNGGDVDLGNGTISGADPLVYYGGSSTHTLANWNAGTNYGTGGDFTVTGALT